MARALSKEKNQPMKGGCVQRKRPKAHGLEGPRIASAEQPELGCDEDSVPVQIEPG
jgi:hypothetical protein